MKHEGKAGQAGIKMLSLSIVMLAVGVAVLFALPPGAFFKWTALTLAFLWAGFAIFVINFFRDPDPAVPSDPKAIVAPGHGTVDVVDETTEPEFMRGPCRRISIFLSVVDVHVQNAPVTGKVAFLEHRSGKFLNAMRADCGLHNENVLVGLESPDPSGGRIAFRLIAGLIARRIVPWVALGDAVERGERTSLIQFGSRVDLYLPLSAKVNVRPGDKVKGGETIVATSA